VARQRAAGNEFARTPPVLAVEVCGEEEPAAMLRSVHVVTAVGDVEVADRIPESASMPGLSLAVGELFRQI
jgi:hypothetical protein